MWGAKSYPLWKSSKGDIQLLLISKVNLIALYRLLLDLEISTGFNTCKHNNRKFAHIEDSKFKP